MFKLSLHTLLKAQLSLLAVGALLLPGQIAAQSGAVEPTAAQLAGALEAEWEKDPALAVLVARLGRAKLPQDLLKRLVSRQHRLASWTAQQAEVANTRGYIDTVVGGMGGTPHFQYDSYTSLEQLQAAARQLAIDATLITALSGPGAELSERQKRLAAFCVGVVPDGMYVTEECVAFLRSVVGKREADAYVHYIHQFETLVRDPELIIGNLDGFVHLRVYVISLPRIAAATLLPLDRLAAVRTPKGYFPRQVTAVAVCPTPVLNDACGAVGPVGPTWEHDLGATELVVH